MKITESALARLPLPEKPYALYWDERLPGFGVRITARGVKSFIVQTSVGGRERRMTLGRCGVLTVAQARKEAAQLLGAVACGRDPWADNTREALKGVTLEVAFARYLRTRPLKPSTREDMRRALEGGFKDWMRRPLGSITRDKVAARHQQLGQASPARANLAMRYLRAVFNFAMAEYTDRQGRPVLTDNPVQRLSQTRTWYRVPRRQTVIKPHELKPWLQAVLGLEHTAARDYFLLVLLTGLRRTEALTLRWQSVDLTGRTLTVEETKNGQAHTLPLSDYLVALLTRRRAETTGEYVFETPRGRLSNLRRPLAAVASRSGVSFCVHDLRRTFATVADALDIPGYAVKALLNHKTSQDVTAGYIVVNVERLRRPMQKITDFVLEAGGLREKKQTPREVTYKGA